MHCTYKQRRHDDIDTNWATAGNCANEKFTRTNYATGQIRGAKLHLQLAFRRVRPFVDTLCTVCTEHRTDNCTAQRPSRQRPGFDATAMGAWPEIYEYFWFFIFKIMKNRQTVSLLELNTFGSVCTYHHYSNGYMRDILL